ncbi:MAG: hypothetical protein DI601_02290 [Azospirillum brasilense]|nr:MAG: hypothetical protein DI601_02290 [Azospirillum brasilense]
MATLNFDRIHKKVAQVHFFFGDKDKWALPEPTPVVDLALRDEILEAALEGQMAAPFGTLPYRFYLDGDPLAGTDVGVQSGVRIDFKAGMSAYDPDMQVFSTLCLNIRRAAIGTTQIVVREMTKSLSIYP